MFSLDLSFPRTSSMTGVRGPPHKCRRRNLWTSSPQGRPCSRLPASEICEVVKVRLSLECGAIVGGFLCYGLIALKTINPVVFPNRSVPGREAYDIAFWMAKFALQACGEAVAVLAILSGVVKVVELDVRRQVPVSVEKEECRNA
jgi:hypothetical protein